MNIRQLQYFAAVAGTLNFTKAARKLYVSQTAVTQQIQALEKEMNLVLFKRNHRHVELTPEGKAFLPAVRSILQELQEAEERCHNLTTGITGSLTIGMVKDYAAVNFVDVLDRFSRNYPNISLRFLRLTAGAIHEALVTGKIDFAINIKFDTDCFQELRTLDLATANLTAVVSRSHPLARRNAVNRADLNDEDLFILETQENEKIDEHQQVYHSLFPDNTHHGKFLFIPDVETIFFLASSNQGIGLVGDYVSQLPLFEKHVKSLPLADIQHQLTIVAEWNETNKNPSLQRLLEMIGVGKPD
ncbi:LysR family transcriptional regulator [Dialister sp.]|uniref:LysR family transcriptional regulator n=1 Tax=Dialister sp. TaxID=1955814 RepID=UPI003F01AFF8